MKAHARTITTLLCAAALVFAGVLLTSCGSEEPVEGQLFAMDTTITLSAYGDNAEDALAAAEKEVNRLDKMLNAEDPKSEIGRLNAKGNGTLSKDAGTLVQRGMSLYRDTSGLFDIAIHPVMDAWGFTTKDYRVPTDAQLKSLLTHIDAEKINYDPATGKTSFDDNKMSIDLGGIAKGYTSGRLMEVYKENGVDSGLVNLGGNIHVLGSKPDGSKWRIAVEDPSKEDYLGLLEVADRAVITSGAYERNFTEGDKTYHHIIDPRTGYPAESGLKSVTIVSKDGTLADALSTSLYIMGREKAIDFWRSHSHDFDFIILDSEDKVYISSPIAKDFSSEKYTVETVE